MPPQLQFYDTELYNVTLHVDNVGRQRVTAARGDDVSGWRIANISAVMTKYNLSKSFLVRRGAVAPVTKFTCDCRHITNTLHK